jgi:hypothetical protein
VNTFPPLEGRLADAPFASRQLIVLVPDEDMRQLHAPPDAEEQDADSRLRRLRRARTGRSALTGVEARASKIRRAYESLKGQGRSVAFVTHAATATLRFPRGEPVFGTLYAGHPTRPAEYFPVNSFHGDVFDTKVAEAINLLHSLGAFSISVHHVRGWTRGANFEVGGPRLPFKVLGRATRGGSKSITFDGEYSPTTAPALPRDLSWYDREPLWRALAEGRLHSGMTRFQLDVRYDQDFGIDLSLVDSAEKLGLRLGGEFKAQRETVWRMTGHFDQAVTETTDPIWRDRLAEWLRAQKDRNA